MAEIETDSRLRQFKKWFKADKEHTEKWREEAMDCFRFVAGEQWSEEDKAKLREQMRPVITFNRIQPVVNSVSGMEIGNRQEASFIPREAGDSKPNQLLTEANRWFRDQANGDDEDSDAFMDAIICGLGVTETTLDFEEDEEGAPEINSVNPLEFYWDSNARKKNLLDARRVWRVREMALSEAERLFPDFSKSELDASWAKDDLSGDTKDQDRDRMYLPDDDDDTEAGSEDKVTIVQCQWIEYVSEYRTINPMNGEPLKVDKKGLDRLSKIWTMTPVGMMSGRDKPPHDEIKKKVVKQAFIGGKVLEEGDTLCKEHFSFRCVTAYRDKTTGLFYGLVRQMLDPQRWANKWMSQALDILNSSTKGGVMMEESAVDDKRAFLKDYARADKPLIVADGSLSNPNGARIVPKPPPANPGPFFQIMEFAISSVRDVTGVNVEMLGMRDANQAASLEYQRRQAGMQILAPMFDNLRRYRREQAKNMLYIIQNHLSDGRLVRIVGEGGAKYVPLMKQAEIKYDIVIDDMPTSPNQKEMIARAITPLMPNLPPPVQLQFMKYLLPESVGEQFEEIMKKSSQPNPMMMEGQKAKIEGKKAKAAKDMADAMKTRAEMPRMAAQTEGEGYRAKGAALDNVAKLTGLMQQGAV